MLLQAFSKRTTPARIAQLLLLSLCAVALSMPVDAARKKRSKSSNRQTTAVGSVKFIPGSGENAAQRDKRLSRECKGRPNAGACLGYAY